MKSVTELRDNESSTWGLHSVAQKPAWEHWSILWPPAKDSWHCREGPLDRPVSSLAVSSAEPVPWSTPQFSLASKQLDGLAL